MPGRRPQRIPANAMPAGLIQWKGFPMTQMNIIGLVALAVGGVLLFFAWRATQAPIEQVSEALTGRFTGNTMWYLLGGVASVVAGAALIFRGSTAR
jgi:hypothetical protein